MQHLSKGTWGPGSSALVQMLPHFLAWVSVSITAWQERHLDNITIFPLFVTIMEVSKDELEVEPKDQLLDPKVDPEEENPEDTLHDWIDAGELVKREEVEDAAIEHVQEVAASGAYNQEEGHFNRVRKEAWVPPNFRSTKILEASKVRSRWRLEELERKQSRKACKTQVAVDLEERSLARSKRKKVEPVKTDGTLRSSTKASTDDDIKELLGSGGRGS